LLLGLAAVLSAEAVIVVALLEELLSPVGAAALTLGLVAVVALLILIQLRRIGRPVAASLPLFALWPERGHKALDVLAGLHGSRGGAGANHANGDAIRDSGPRTGTHKAVSTGRMPAVTPPTPDTGIESEPPAPAPHQPQAPGAHKPEAPAKDGPPS